MKESSPDTSDLIVILRRKMPPLLDAPNSQIITAPKISAYIRI